MSVFQIRLFAHGWLALALMNPSPRTLSLHECDKTYVFLEKVIYIQKYKFASLFGDTVSKTQFTVLGIALSFPGFPRITGCSHG